ncbi:MAG: hypothetical protein R3C53_10995 [Pirellulaceae bacterium]
MSTLLSTLKKSWLPCGILLFAFVASNWIFRYELVASSRSEALRPGSKYSISADHAEIRSNFDHYRAGVPWTYYQANCYAGGDRLVKISWLKLLGNMGFFLTLVFAVLIHESNAFGKRRASDYKYEEEVSTVPEKRKRRGVRISDVMIFTAILACAFGYWRLLERRSAYSRDLIDRLARTGSVGVSTVYLPLPLAGLVPGELYSTSVRVGEVPAIKLGDELMDSKLLRCPIYQRQK